MILSRIILSVSQHLIRRSFGGFLVHEPTLSTNVFIESVEYFEVVRSYQSALIHEIFYVVM